MNIHMYLVNIESPLKVKHHEEVLWLLGDDGLGAAPGVLLRPLCLALFVVVVSLLKYGCCCWRFLAVKLIIIVVVIT